MKKQTSDNLFLIFINRVIYKCGNETSCTDNSEQFLDILYNIQSKHTSKRINKDIIYIYIKRMQLMNCHTFKQAHTILNNRIKLNKPSYERKGIYTIEDVESILKEPLMEFINQKKENPTIASTVRNNIMFYQDKINLKSQRYMLFFTKGYTCVNCGLTGLYFALERQHVEKWHLNLYALDKFGNEVLMTKDHIIPKSLGGENHINNYQTMCFKCNFNKGNKIE